LHERAALNLMTILREIPKMQIIIACHSASILRKTPLSNIISSERRTVKNLSDKSGTFVDILGEELSAIDFSMFRAYGQVFLGEGQNDKEFIEHCLKILFGATTASNFSKCSTYWSMNGRKSPKELKDKIRQLRNHLPASQVLKVLIIQDSDYFPTEVIEFERELLQRYTKRFDVKNGGKVEVFYHVWDRVEIENYLLETVKSVDGYGIAIDKLQEIAPVRMAAGCNIGLLNVMKDIKANSNMFTV